MDNILKNHTTSLIETHSRERSFDFAITKKKDSKKKYLFNPSFFFNTKQCMPKQTLQTIDENCVLESSAEPIKAPTAIQFGQFTQLSKTEINLQLVLNNQQKTLTQRFILEYIQDIVDSMIKSNAKQMTQTTLFDATNHVDKKLLKKLNRYMTITAADDSINGISSLIFFATIKPLFKGFYDDFVIKTSNFISHNSLLASQQEEDSVELKATQSVFKSETTILSRLKHENIVKLLGYHIAETYQNPCSYFLILKRYQIDAFELFYRQEIEIQKKSQTIFLLFYQILAALEYLQDERIIHGDLKLENFFGNQDYTSWCLGDFGCAVCLTKKTYRQAPIFTGSRGYQAPEIYQDQNLTQTSDLYSWGQSILAVYSTNEYGTNDIITAFHHKYDAHMRLDGELDFFTQNRYMWKLYLRLTSALEISQFSSPYLITQYFKKQPINMAKHLWFKCHPALFPHNNSEKNIQAANDAMHIMLLPMILTTAQHDPLQRGNINMFREYMKQLQQQYLLTC
ncbi:MAG: protein kinase family protein [Endozoicomonadaceae bacterium]|nr:protein kinase family protein [Endozoicomonadaceae bacterium]